VSPRVRSWARTWPARNPAPREPSRPARCASACRSRPLYSSSPDPDRGRGGRGRDGVRLAATCFRHADAHRAGRDGSRGAGFLAGHVRAPRSDARTHGSRSWTRPPSSRGRCAPSRRSRALISISNQEVSCRCSPHPPARAPEVLLPAPCSRWIARAARGGALARLGLAPEGSAERKKRDERLDYANGARLTPGALLP